MSEPDVVELARRYADGSGSWTALITRWRSSVMHVQFERRSTGRSLVTRNTRSEGILVPVYSTLARLHRAAGVVDSVERARGDEIERVILPYVPQITGVVVDPLDEHMFLLPVNPADPMVLPLPPNTSSFSSRSPR